MTTLSQQRRVVDIAFELMRKLAIEPPVSDERITSLRNDLERACNAAWIPYGQAVRCAVLAMQEANDPRIHKLFRLAQSGARGDVLTLESHDGGAPMLHINPLKVNTC